jgi:hypothetical protein
MLVAKPTSNLTKLRNAFYEPRIYPGFFLFTYCSLPTSLQGFCRQAPLYLLKAFEGGRKAM